ncbi:unnamed protein product [Heterosigma akashiwo]
MSARSRGGITSRIKYVFSNLYFYSTVLGVILIIACWKLYYVE